MYPWWCSSVRHVSVMLAVSWPSLVSPPPGDDGIFTERVGRMEWDERTARRPGSSISHACAGTSVFLTCDVFGGSVWASKYFPNWFSVSSFLQIMHLIHSVTDEKVLSVWAQGSPDQPELQTQTLKTSYFLKLILMYFQKLVGSPGWFIYSCSFAFSAQ